MVKKKEIIRWILLGILVGVITRLSDFFDYDHFLVLIPFLLYLDSGL